MALCVSLTMVVICEMKERQGWKEEQGPWGVRDTTKESWWPLE